MKHPSTGSHTGLLHQLLRRAIGVEAEPALAASTPHIEAFSSRQDAPLHCGELVSVLPINRSYQPAAGHITLIALERYADGSILRFLAASRIAGTIHDPQVVAYSRPFYRPFGSNLSFGLEDDLRTSYTANLGGGEDGRVWRGETRFWPSIPEGAGALTLSLYATPDQLQARIWSIELTL